MNSTVSPHPEVKRPNRRECLYYLGGASLLLLVGEVGVGLSKFLNPPPVYGERSGIYKIDLKEIPVVGESPKAFPLGQYWLINSEEGLIALDGWCTTRHEKLVKWVDTNDRYECPQCGAKFRINGEFIEGPAKRGLDKLLVEVTTDKGMVTTPMDGSLVSLDGAQQVVINSIGRIPGKPRLPQNDEFTPPIGNAG